MGRTSSRRRARLLRGLVVAGAVLGALMLPPRPAETHAAFSGVHVLNSTRQAVVIEYISPLLSLARMDADGQDYVEVRAGDLPLCGQPGEPQLPCAGTLLGLPPTGSATVRVLEQDTSRRPLSAPVYPVPMPAPAMRRCTSWVRCCVMAARHRKRPTSRKLLPGNCACRALA